MPDSPLQLERQSSAIEQRYAPSALLDCEIAVLGQAWLSPHELVELATWRNPHRRQEWLRGRLLAKQLVADGMSSRCSLQEIEIVQQSDSRRPRVLVHGSEKCWSISISHSARGVLVAVSRRCAITVGADVTDCEPLSTGFVRLWFTPAEIARLRNETAPFVANTFWATKEALYKACNLGEGFDPRRIEVLPDRCNYRGTPIDCHVQSSLVDDQVAVVVTVRNQIVPRSL